MKRGKSPDESTPAPGRTKQPKPVSSTDPSGRVEANMIAGPSWPLERRAFAAGAAGPGRNLSLEVFGPRLMRATAQASGA